jgi:hypothetical protein
MAAGNTQGDGSGNSRWLLVDDLGRLRLNDDFDPIVEINDANANTLSFTVPTDMEWEIQSIFVEYQSSVSAGNRNLVVEIKDDNTPSNVILRVIAGAIQAASLTRYYVFAPGVPDLTAFRDTDYLSTPIPQIRLPSSFVIVVRDIKAIATDYLEVSIMLKQRAATPELGA